MEIKLLDRHLGNSLVGVKMTDMGIGSDDEDLSHTW